MIGPGCSVLDTGCTSPSQNNHAHRTNSSWSTEARSQKNGNLLTMGLKKENTSRKPGCCVCGSRKYFTETEMPKLYAELRENVEKELCDLKYFATTTDLWSSRISYWNLGSRCLQTSYFLAEQTAEEIAQGLKEALESWGF
ncbi:zinc finger BED domain-containing 1-like protein [Labeo rohita]|uniref:Zinc finger BED domain-containing 1-like protein n=1 Tax=Labeo rohita TaxID=84645 RepID=A0A498M7B1_LABRO|nr:zinc finger BED domain-containing 1-like protein [Labeo rohita]